MLLAVASVAVFIGGAVALVASAFWMAEVFLPLGIGGVVGGWLIFERSMERIARDSETDAGS